MFFVFFFKDIWQLITERGEGPENPDSVSVIAGLSHVGEMWGSLGNINVWWLLSGQVTQLRSSVFHRNCNKNDDAQVECLLQTSSVASFKSLVFVLRMHLFLYGKWICCYKCWRCRTQVEAYKDLAIIKTRVIQSNSWYICLVFCIRYLRCVFLLS